MPQVASYYPPVPLDPKMGPAMAKLSPQQRAWVNAYLDTGCKSKTLAARMAGYAVEGREQSVRAAGYRLAHDEDVLAAIKELADKKVRSGAFVAMAVLQEIANDATHKDRFKAAVEIANRTGMIVAHKVEHEHAVSLDAKQVYEQIKELARELNMTPTQAAKLLGTAGYTEAEFVPVEAQQVLTDAREPAMSSEGLEDLL